MLLLQSIAALGKIRNYRDQERESAKVFQYFEEGPTAKQIGYPQKRPFNSIEGNHPRIFRPAANEGPVFRPCPMLKDRHLLRSLARPRLRPAIEICSSFAP